MAHLTKPPTRGLDKTKIGATLSRKGNTLDMVSEETAHTTDTLVVGTNSPEESVIPLPATPTPLPKHYHPAEDEDVSYGAIPAPGFVITWVWDNARSITKALSQGRHLLLAKEGYLRNPEIYDVDERGRVHHKELLAFVEDEQHFRERSEAPRLKSLSRQKGWRRSIPVEDGMPVEESVDVSRTTARVTTDFDEFSRADLAAPGRPI